MIILYLWEDCIKTLVLFSIRKSYVYNIKIIILKKYYFNKLSYLLNLSE